MSAVLDPIRRSTRQALQQCGLEVIVSQSMRRVMILRRGNRKVELLRNLARVIEEKVVVLTTKRNTRWDKDLIHFVVFDTYNDAVSNGRDECMAAVTHFHQPRGYTSINGVYFKTACEGIVTEGDVERADTVLSRCV